MVDAVKLVTRCSRSYYVLQSDVFANLPIIGR